MSHYTPLDWVIILIIALTPYAVCFWSLFKQSVRAIPPADNLSPDYQNADPINLSQPESASSTAKAIEESYSVCQQTVDLNVFKRNLELATRNTYKLKQMEETNLYDGSPPAEYYFDIFIRNQNDLLHSFLRRAFYDNLRKAKNESKNQKEIVKRMDQFFLQMENSSLDFDKNIMSALKKELEM